MVFYGKIGEVPWICRRDAHPLVEGHNNRFSGGSRELDIEDACAALTGSSYLLALTWACAAVCWKVCSMYESHGGDTQHFVDIV